MYIYIGSKKHKIILPMQQKFTLIEMERLLSLETSDMKTQTVHPKAQTVNFIRQFAYVYHTERKIPLPLAAMILN